ncbi:DUF2285 domain-containing protein [Bartonella sp. LJL80]
MSFIPKEHCIYLYYRQINHMRKRNDHWDLILNREQHHLRIACYGSDDFIETPLLTALGNDPDRLTGHHRLLCAINGYRIPPDQRLTKMQKLRLIKMLQAVDSQSGVASTREIATAIFGEQMIAGTHWKTSSVRIKTLNLLQDGLRMVNGGYKNLLRQNRKK